MADLGRIVLPLMLLDNKFEESQLTKIGKKIICILYQTQ